MYTLLRPLLFSLDAESAHHLTLESLQIAARTGVLRPCLSRVAPMPCRVMGIEFPNPVGLAAGLDKNGDYIDALAALGFGFLEIGTITPRPQPGNPRPRMFRLPEARAVINRMGFNNHGVDALLANVQRARYRGVLGINIGKNFDTPIERAADDYLICLRKVYSSATYITVNISSPNTKNLRQLQQSDELGQLLMRQPRELTEGGTSLSAALVFSASLFAAAPSAERRVIDVSTDGRNNSGPPVAPVRDRVVAQGITINGLTILNEWPTLDTYAEGNVAGGPGHFVIPANDYEAYGEAILRKLLREITGPGIT
jgi:hypothetical protein